MSVKVITREKFIELSRPESRTFFSNPTSSYDVANRGAISMISEGAKQVEVIRVEGSNNYYVMFKI